MSYLQSRRAEDGGKNLESVGNISSYFQPCLHCEAKYFEPAKFYCSHCSQLSTWLDNIIVELESGVPMSLQNIEHQSFLSTLLQIVHFLLCIDFLAVYQRL